MKYSTFRRPSWARPFIDAPLDQSHAQAHKHNRNYNLTIYLCLTCAIGLVLQVCLLLTSRNRFWISLPSIAWLSALLFVVVTRHVTFSALLLVIFTGLTISETLLFLSAWDYKFTFEVGAAIAGAVLSILGLLIILNVPMTPDGSLQVGVSKPFTEPTNKLRSPEDNLTMWQWMTISWILPTLKTAKGRRLEATDVWQLPYEFQHRPLFENFTKLKGSVLQRILRANWMDVVILVLLELFELITNYSVPLLLQQLLRAMKQVDVDKTSALKWGLLIFVAKFSNGQSEVFSLWYSRRAYERVRGELITMLYDKTLNRKVLGMPEPSKETVDNDTGNDIAVTNSDETTPLLSKSQRAPEASLSALWGKIRSAWAFVYNAGRKTAEPADDAAGTGKIYNLIRYDAYEVAQRFWEAQYIIERPVGLLLSLLLVFRFVGWSCFLGIAVVLVGQIVNFFLAKLQIRFEKARRKRTDARLQQTSQYVEAIRHLRWYGWQNYWMDRIFDARQRELNMQLLIYIWEVLMTLNNTLCSSAVPVVAFYGYTKLAGKELTVDVAFPALSLFLELQYTLLDIPELIYQFLGAYVALGRIQKFMDEPIKGEQIEPNDGEGSNVRFDHATFAWPGYESNVLHDISLQFGPGITIIAGEVASGKTALLQAFLGELDMKHGSLVKSRRPIAYCAQTPWLQSMTIRDNILFNAPYEPDRYRQTLEVCALLPDLAAFKQGDLSPIGENGIGLSGGQKARVALARAVYSHTDILLLDDPLSALDQQTAQHIVSECISGPLLRNRTVVLVTHRIDLCQSIAGQLITIKAGRATVLNPAASDKTECPSNNLTRMATSEKIDIAADAIPAKFEEEESRAVGDVALSVYWDYLRAGKLIWWIVIVLGCLFSRLSSLGQNWFLKEWTEAYGGSNDRESTFSTGVIRVFTHIHGSSTTILHRFFQRFPDPAVNVTPWLLGFFAVITLQSFALSLSEALMIVTRYYTSKNLFRSAIEKVSSTCFRYYDVTPVGRLMNRLTSDIGTIDGGISWVFFSISYSIVTWIASILVIASITPAFLVVSILLTLWFVFIFMYFLPASQNLRRLEAVSLSPLMSNFGTLLTGLTTVRAFRAEPQFIERAIQVTDDFQRMDHFYWSVQNWLAYRLDTLAALSTFVMTLIAIYTNVSAGLTAFVLISADKFVSATHRLCRLYGSLQVSFVSVERVVELIHLEQEESNPVPPPAWWPSFGGSIVFENVTVRYAPDLDPALTSVSFELKGGTNTAVVGRTGSGKSTLAAALLATVPVETGRILVDGIDLAKIDKQALRSRITFLAQEPVLFEGTIRHNLDPTREHSDKDCLAVLSRVCGRFGWKLDDAIDAGGKNLSQGQRQLIGLTRAILRRSSIIIMDEATASIDIESAWEVQRVLREELKRSTVITIAHRATAVRDVDNALVLSDGRLSSFGLP